MAPSDRGVLQVFNTQLMNNDNGAKQRDRQRLAWIVLLGSSGLCLLLTIAVPLSMNAALHNMKRPLTTIVQANQGTVRVDDALNISTVLIAGEPGKAINDHSRILTDATSAATMLIYPHDEVVQPLARLQIYSRSTVNLNEADTPRFAVSNEPQSLDLTLDNGRAQLNIPLTIGRDFVTVLHTPHGSALFSEPGQYVFLVDNESTQVTVLEGSGEVVAQRKSLTLQSDQRAEIVAGQSPSGPLVTERNLVQNGDFGDFWEKWALYVWNVELSEQPKGSSELTEVGGEPAITFKRGGQGHADIKVRQIIDQDVTDLEALQLQLTFRITEQSLGVCGVQGSECPLIVRVNYTDKEGIRRIWQQGFFANGDISNNSPDICISCAVIQDVHARVPLNVVQFYETDLLEALARQGAPPPQIIDDITLVSSGHSFAVDVLDVALVGVE